MDELIEKLRPSGLGDYVGTVGGKLYHFKKCANCGHYLPEPHIKGWPSVVGELVRGGVWCGDCTRANDEEVEAHAKQYWDDYKGPPVPIG